MYHGPSMLFMVLVDVILDALIPQDWVSRDVKHAQDVES